MRHVEAAAPHLRIDTLNCALDVMHAIITGQSVNLSMLCGHEKSVEAKKRRTERALKDEQLMGNLFLPLIVLLLPPGKLLLLIPAEVGDVRVGG